MGEVKWLALSPSELTQSWKSLLSTSLSCWQDPTCQTTTQYSLLLLPDPHIWVTYTEYNIYYKLCRLYSVRAFCSHKWPRRNVVFSLTCRAHCCPPVLYIDMLVFFRLSTRLWRTLSSGSHLLQSLRALTLPLCLLTAGSSTSPSPPPPNPIPQLINMSTSLST